MDSIHPPLRRHPALRPLSRDHYVALVQARRLIAASAGTPAQRRAALAQFLDAWRTTLGPHFAAEQRLLLGLAERQHGNQLCHVHALLEAWVREAREMRASVTPNAARMRRMGEILRDHVRWEERTLYRAIQHDALPEQLDALATATAAIDAARGRMPASRATRDS